VLVVVAAVAVYVVVVLLGDEPAQGPSPSSPVATTSAPGSPSTSPVPDARAVSVESLLRPDTVPVETLYGDLDGDGIEEIVLQAVSREPAPGTLVPQPFLDVFALRDGEVVNVLDATGPAPPGADRSEPMIQTGDLAGAQQVDFLEVVAFREGEPPSLVAGVLVLGATAGPLSVWVVSMEDGGFVTEFFQATTRGGLLSVDARTLLLTTGRYRPTDPGCCPSRIEHQRIGADPATGEIGVLSRRLERP
jgi:hypothetical protein